MSATKPRSFSEKSRRLKACVTDDPETIHKLSQDPSGWVREGLLYNPKVASGVLFRGRWYGFRVVLAIGKLRLLRRLPRGG